MASAGVGGGCSPIGNGMVPWVRTVFSAAVIRSTAAAARARADASSGEASRPNAGAAEKPPRTDAAQSKSSLQTVMRLTSEHLEETKPPVASSASGLDPSPQTRDERRDSAQEPRTRLEAHARPHAD